MNKLVPVGNCTGCAACSICCPKDAIAMLEDREGFLYPCVDQNKCDTCGLCIKICPVSSTSPAKPKGEPTLYAGWSNDNALLRQCTSGGVFSEIARSIIEEGGVVFGAAYDKEMQVRHVAVEKSDNLHALRGSKYVQSDVGDTYAQAERYLKSGRRVLFSGTPCQVAGLYVTIRNGHENLMTCDLICHGVPSPKVFRMALDTLEKCKGSKVVGFNFREKSCGWLYPTVQITFADRTVLDENNTDNYFNLGFLKNIYLRPSCYRCPIKDSGSMADITLGDFWQLLECQPSLINHGTSAVLVNTERGRQLIQECSGHLTLTECLFSYVEKESNLFKSVKPSLERTAFFADIDRLSFNELTRKYIRPRNVILRKLARIRRVVRRKIEEWK